MGVIQDAFEGALTKVLGKFPFFIAILGIVLVLGSYTRYDNNGFAFRETQPAKELFWFGLIIVLVAVVIYILSVEEPTNLAEVSTYKGDWIYQIEMTHKGRKRIVYAHMELKPNLSYGNYKASGHVWLLGEKPDNKTLATWDGYASFLGAERLVIVFAIRTKPGILKGYNNPSSYNGMIDIVLSKDLKLLEGSVHDFEPLAGTGQFYAKRPNSKNVKDIRQEAYQSFGQLRHS